MSNYATASRSAARTGASTSSACSTSRVPAQSGNRSIVHLPCLFFSPSAVALLGCCGQRNDPYLANFVRHRCAQVTSESREKYRARQSSLQCVRADCCSAVPLSRGPWQPSQPPSSQRRGAAARGQERRMHVARRRGLAGPTEKGRRTGQPWTGSVNSWAGHWSLCRLTGRPSSQPARGRAAPRRTARAPAAGSISLCSASEMSPLSRAGATSARSRVPRASLGGAATH